MKRLFGIIGICTFILNSLAKPQKLDKLDIQENLEEVGNITKPFVKQIFNEGAHMTLLELIQSNGFPVEIHKVTSIDGYITTLFRIPRSRFPNNNISPKKVVYLHHGFVVDSGSWFLNSVNKALAYRLADLGNVDVWMGNSRGTVSSLGHVNMNHKNYRYWNFTFHEIGVYDLPKIIDYILNLTDQPDMYYIGHSMGCAVLAVTLSTFPEYNSKIRTFIALAPAIFIGNASNHVSNLAPVLVPSAQAVHDALLWNPIIPPSLLGFSSFLGDFCAPRVIFRYICYALVESFFGYDTQETNYDMSAEITSHGFSSTSTKTFFHLLQNSLKGEFNQFDYGDKNLQIYGRPDAPEYDLRKVTVPTVLYCASSDNLVPCVDVDRLAEALPNVKQNKRIIWPKFSHIDFMYAADINPLLNDRLIEIVDQDLFYNKKVS